MTESDANTPGTPLVTAAGLDAVLAHADEAVLGCDADGTVRFASEAFRTLLGYAPEMFVGRNITEIVHPDQLAFVVEAIARWSGRVGSPQGDPIRVRAADGSWVEVRYDAAIGQDFGAIGSLVLTLRLESSVSVAERALRTRVLNDDRIVRLSSAFLHLPADEFDKGLDVAMAELGSLESVLRASVWQAEGDRVVRRAYWQAPASLPTLPLSERARVDDFGSLRRARAGQETFLFLPWQHGPEFDGERALFDEAGITSVLVEPIIAGDTFVGALLLENTLGDEFGATHFSAARSACAVLAEAFTRHEVEDRLAVQARTDRVTGLANRWAFDAELDRALSDLAAGSTSGVALAIVDLDRFKVVNDTYGHGVGDQLLHDVADRLVDASSPRTMLARLGGDELLVLVEDVATADAAHRAVEELLDALVAPFDVSEGVLAVTVSAGVVHTTDPTDDVDVLMRAADLAQYRAKSIGGDAVLLADVATTRAQSVRLRRETELREAVDRGQLVVHYQGEFDLVTGALVGAEALVRWPHPTDGLLAAGEFVPLAEASGLINELGRQVLREACRDVASWQQSGGNVPFTLRVNLSARQVRQPDLVDQVGDALADCGLDPSVMCVELTESTLLADPVGAAAHFDALRELGVGLAIDDFGTGYSSLLQLRSLPLTALKIDQSFVAGLAASAADRAIVRATLDLAAALGLDVTAEGVETAAQRDVLVELGCPRAQGFLLGRPVSAAQFAAVAAG